MTLNIIQEIKDRSRRETKPTELSIRCRKWRKNIVPLKWVALALIIILPVLQIPNWCVKKQLFGPGTLRTDQCDPDEYPNSNLPKL